MSRGTVRRPGWIKAYLPALGLALAVVALFAVSLVAIVLSLWLLVNVALHIVVQAMGL